MTIRERLERDREQIIQRVKNGESAKSLGKYYKCNSGTVWFFLRDIGVATKTKRSENYGSIEKQKDEIMDLLSQDMSVYKISQKLGMSKASLLRWVKIWGYDTSKKNKLDLNKPFLKDQYEKVIEMYNSGISQNEISKILGYSGGQICILLQKYNIEIRPVNTYTVDETFFEQIDTEYKAYILGWFYSDGNVMSDGKMRIALQVKDRKILEWIKTTMKYDGPLYEKKAKNATSQPQTELCINRQVLARQLIKLGCFPHKSLSLKCPEYDIVPQHLFHHFVRGYFDGDGAGGRSIQITGSYHFIYRLKELLPLNISNIYQRHKERKPEEDAHQLSIGNKENRRAFYNWLYKDATIWLDRKKKKIEQHI